MQRGRARARGRAGARLARHAFHRARQALAAFDIDAAAQKPTVGALNRAFHIALVKPGGQRITTQIVARLHVLADRYVRKHLEPKGRVLRAEAEHHEMLEAWLKRKDAKVRKRVERVYRALAALADARQYHDRQQPISAGQLTGLLETAAASGQAAVNGLELWMAGPDWLALTERLRDLVGTVLDPTVYQALEAVVIQRQALVFLDDATG